jgi:hypothetical protein
MVRSLERQAVISGRAGHRGRAGPPAGAVRQARRGQSPPGPGPGSRWLPAALAGPEGAPRAVEGAPAASESSRGHWQPGAQRAHQPPAGVAATQWTSACPAAWRQVPSACSARARETCVLGCAVLKRARWQVARECRSRPAPPLPLNCCRRHRGNAATFGRRLARVADSSGRMSGAHATGPWQWASADWP